MPGTPVLFGSFDQNGGTIPFLFQSQHIQRFIREHVQSVAIDKKGFLWIGTIDGLNVYDGNTITTYKKETQPEIAANNIIYMTCDSKNRLWLGTHEGITWMDENRQFHRVVLNDSVTRFGCRTIPTQGEIKKE